MKALAITTALAAVLLMGRSLWVWEQCGYDCDLVPGLASVSAIAGQTLGVVLILVAALLGMLGAWRRRSGDPP